MIRRNFDINKLIKQIEDDQKDIKSTQFIGHDNTKLNLFEASNNTYDVTYTTTLAIENQVTFLSRFEVNFRPWQPSGYGKTYTQIYLGDTSTPYEGFSQDPDAGFFHWDEASNLANWYQSDLTFTGTNPGKTYFVKYYLITTAESVDHFEVTAFAVEG